MDKVMNFFNKFIAGEFGYGKLTEAVKNMNAEVVANEELSVVTSLFASFASIMPYIYMALMLVIAFWGKKLLPLIKFVSAFAVGFALGVCCVHEVVVKVVPIPAIVSGLVMAILAIIIYRLLYVIFFGALSFYGTFTLCYALLGTALASLAGLESYVFLAVAAIVMIVSFVLRKYVEMLGTSVVGGLVIAKLVAKSVFDYTTISIFADKAWLAYLLVTVVIALPAFVVQVKTRRRY